MLIDLAKSPKLLVRGGEPKYFLGGEEFLPKRCLIKNTAHQSNTSVLILDGPLVQELCEAMGLKLTMHVYFIRGRTTADRWQQHITRDCTADGL